VDVSGIALGDRVREYPGKCQPAERGIALLTQHRKRIQGLVGRAVVLKYTPTLKFLIDDFGDQGKPRSPYH